MSFTRLRYHLVTGTKERRPLIDPDIEPVLYKYMKEAAEETGGKIVEIGGIEDHVHVVAAVRPTVTPSSFMQRIKGESTRRLRAENDYSQFEWQEGYAGFTLNPFDLRKVRTYVRNQKEHHEHESIWNKFEIWKKLEAIA